MTPMQVLINVDVDDLDKATHFYETAFGLKVGRRFGVPGVEVLGSSAPIYLLVKALDAFGHLRYPEEDLRSQVGYDPELITIGSSP
jgi:catechol 2,3-dioxygenase-like lactoylglutathione lyase family enzyme